MINAPACCGVSRVPALARVQSTRGSYLATSVFKAAAALFAKSISEIIIMRMRLFQRMSDFVCLVTSRIKDTATRRYLSSSGRYKARSYHNICIQLSALFAPAWQRAESSLRCCVRLQTHVVLRRCKENRDNHPSAALTVCLCTVPPLMPRHVPL